MPLHVVHVIRRERIKVIGGRQVGNWIVYDQRIHIRCVRDRQQRISIRRKTLPKKLAHDGTVLG